jgi:uncharacterized protein (DUF2252 family)
MTAAGDRPSERYAAGKALRGQVPREAHAAWEPPAGRRDPVVLLEESNEGRIPELIPLRYQRMLHSPFSFYRGAAMIMGSDLASTPATGARVQICGDCHLMNFGGFATPERNLFFDVNDFDETIPGPWEWDLKRLSASLVLAARYLNFKHVDGESAVLSAVESYRRHMFDYLEMTILDIWYSRLDVSKLEVLLEKKMRAKPSRDPARLNDRTLDHVIAKITEVGPDGRRRIVDQPPLIVHASSEGPLNAHVEHTLANYRRSLEENLRFLVDRYRFDDAAYKVVGVGSVGTRCAIVLLSADERNTLLLQMKQAQHSVLEPYVGASRFTNMGQRVVVGQHLMQAASDMFLGWTNDDNGRDYYFRQLRDMKTAVSIDGMSAQELSLYASFCGWALSRAHARTGDPALLAGYMGPGTAFDRALVAFATAYADQTERDFAAFKAAVESGHLSASNDFNPDELTKPTA